MRLENTSFEVEASSMRLFKCIEKGHRVRENSAFVHYHPGLKNLVHMLERHYLEICFNDEVVVEISV